MGPTRDETKFMNSRERETSDRTSGDAAFHYWGRIAGGLRPGRQLRPMGISYALPLQRCARARKSPSVATPQVTLATAFSANPTAMVGPENAGATAGASIRARRCGPDFTVGIPIDFSPSSQRYRRSPAWTGFARVKGCYQHQSSRAIVGGQHPSGDTVTYFTSPTIQNGLIST
jgi:hypothetical protein